MAIQYHNVKKRLWHVGDLVLDDRRKHFNHRGDAIGLDVNLLRNLRPMALSCSRNTDSAA